jgi:glutamate-1-semialdehyde 2,1-aminomutase
MTGHSPAATVSALEQQAKRGITLMLPSEDAIIVGEELQKRFGLPYWQFALTATDANRFSIRLARQITSRPKILVFNWCYHGTVDETFITLQAGVATARRGNIGPPVNPAITTSVVEFNDLDALEAVLRPQDVACVLAEPAMTNVGIVLPSPGYHAALRRITRKHGTLLIIDETHTICAGPGGYTRAENLEPDFLVFGKPIAGGVPGAAYGFSEEVAQGIIARHSLEDCDTGGIGGTLAGNALSLAAMRATLQKVLTKEAFDRMIPMAERWTESVAKAIADFALPWNVTRLGCRAEYLFTPHTPRNGTEAHDAMDFELERFMHLFAMNRGILLTPFHNMALMSPVTSKEDIDQHTKVFRDAAKELVGWVAT